MSAADVSPLDAELDDLIGSSPAHGGVPCAVARILSSLPAETADRLRNLIDGSSVQTTAIAETLERAGYAVSYQSVARHRRRITKPGSGCRCQR